MEWVLDFRHDALTPVFVGLTFLGDVTFFLIFCSLGYWLWRPAAFLRLTLLLLVSALANATLKGAFQVPRPDDIPHLLPADGWSFPSGHAQTAAAVWTWLGLELRRAGTVGRWVWPPVAALVAGIAASRVYLGVHTPWDVVAGTAIGLATVAAGWWLVRHPPPRWDELGLLAKAVGGGAVVLVWVALLPEQGGSRTGMIAGGALLGLWIGTLIERRAIRFAAPRGWRAPVAGALGLAVAFGLRVGLKAGLAAWLPESQITDLIRYTVIGLWIACGAPWLFVRLGWTDRRSG